MKLLIIYLVSFLLVENVAAQITLSHTPTDGGQKGKSKLIRQQDGKLIFVTCTGGNFYSGRILANSEIDDTYNGARTSKKLGHLINCKTLTAKHDKWNRFIIAGSSCIDSNSGCRATIMRLTKNGDPDVDFEPGVMQLSVGDSSEITDVFLQNDEKILAIGSCFIRGAYRFFITRFLYNGQSDSGFATKGVAIDYSMPDNSRVAGSVIQPDGKYIIAGINYADNSFTIIVARYLPNGTKDTTFGIHTIGADSFQPRLKLLSLQPDGKILLAGESDEENGERGVFLMRCNSDGKTDTSFGNAGVVRVKAINNFRIDDMLLLPDGRILLSGAGFMKGEVKYSKYIMLRFSPDGEEDDRYGYGSRNGLKPMSVNSGYTALANNIALSPADGKVYRLSELASGNKPETILTFTTFLQDSSLGIVDIPTGKLQNFVYPAPVTKSVAFSFDLIEDLNITVKLLDINGKEITTVVTNELYKEGENAIIVNFPQSSKPGKYLLVLSSDVGYKMTIEITKI